MTNLPKFLFFFFPLQMVNKRKRLLELSGDQRAKKRRQGGKNWDDFKTSFVGTVKNPLGTLIALLRRDTLPFNRQSNWKGIRTYNSRKGFVTLAGVLGSIATGYIADALKGGMKELFPRFRGTNSIHKKIAYAHLKPQRADDHTIFKRGRGITKYNKIFNKRAGINFGSVLSSLLTSDFAKKIGKKALTSSALATVPFAVNWVKSKFSNRNRNTKMPLPLTYQI